MNRQDFNIKPRVLSEDSKIQPPYDCEPSLAELIERYYQSYEYSDNGYSQVKEKTETYIAEWLSMHNKLDTSTPNLQLRKEEEKLKAIQLILDL